MRIYVDQSGRIEDTRVDTALAFSNDRTGSILIPATTKRQCLTLLRNRGKSGPTLYLQMFAAVLFLLLREHFTMETYVTIDQEYEGRERSIKSYLINLLRRDGVLVNAEQIQFGWIGKKSHAHRVAIEVFRGTRPADRTISLVEILQMWK